MFICILGNRVDVNTVISCVAWQFLSNSSVLRKRQFSRNDEQQSCVSEGQSHEKPGTKKFAALCHRAQMA